MNTYEISWQETVRKSVTVTGNTREEAWEAFNNKEHSKPKTKGLVKNVPGIQIINKGETNG
ncbi:hypothetical protein UFOVP111_11 [uncultured Caudovirales phage]|uniref:Uncharacterized protein n=1 Tax=uncultured Caudovirales phage TaxID=2100421 RepID=A0A6J5L1H7_9CAUD|nr:hypothetical protein UFOVP111_11 [uncultured Caudovirales phage]